MYQSTRYVLVAVLYERLVKCGEKDVAQKNTVGHHAIIPLLMAILPRSAHSGAFLSDFSHCLQPVATDVISLLSVSFRGCQSFRSPSLSVSTGHLTLMAPATFLHSLQLRSCRGMTPCAGPISLPRDGTRLTTRLVNSTNLLNTTLRVA